MVLTISIQYILQDKSSLNIANNSPAEIRLFSKMLRLRKAALRKPYDDK